MNISEEKTVSFPCPKCDNEGIRSEARKTKNNNFLCPNCGSVYRDRISAWNLFKK